MDYNFHTKMDQEAQKMEKAHLELIEAQKKMEIAAKVVEALEKNYKASMTEEQWTRVVDIHCELWKEYMAALHNETKLRVENHQKYPRFF